jgi:hypothetical protein
MRKECGWSSEAGVDISSSGEDLYHHVSVSIVSALWLALT